MRKDQLSLKKINEASKVISMRIECGNCKWRFTEYIDNLSIRAYDQECEVCGSHGSVDVSVTCPKCKKNITIEIRSW